MIPVAPQPEPNNFDIKVRQPGRQWLRTNNIPMDSIPPCASELPTYWSRTQKQLWDAYDGVCAYLGIYFDWVLGASSTDHFIAKSRNAGEAYEWSNYRLSCLGANRYKSRFDDIIDPFTMRPETFHINFASGEIFPNPVLTPELLEAALSTINRLKLNEPVNCEMRTQHFNDYLTHDISENYLLYHSPFVHAEACRQNLL